MNILAFDTAMAACSAAVVRCDGAETQVLAEHHEPRTRGHAEVLAPLIREVMTKAAVVFEDLDRIAVTVGPGTFTGVRIGVATARGMAVASGLPVVGITTLEAVAAAAAKSPQAKDRPIACVFDARRGEVYVQCFSHSLTPLTQARALSYRDAYDLIAPHRPLLVGTGMDLLKPVDGSDALAAPEPPLAEQPTAATVAELAALRTTPAEPPEPLYLRPPDAKLPQ